MAANLTAQYRRAENAYRRAQTPDDELRCLEQMLRELPKHKGTDRIQADLKQKISVAKKLVQSLGSAKKKSTGLRVPRQGAGRVVLIGPPNSGRSQFIATSSRANPVVGNYPFTTNEISPSMMPYEDLFIQLIDSPPITADFLDNDLLGIIRGADLVLLFCDLANDDGWQDCEIVMSRLSSTRTRLARETYLSQDDIGLAFTRAFLVYNKCDADDAELRLSFFREAQSTKGQMLEEFEISSITSKGIDDLKQAIFEALDVVRVYTKAPSAKEPDYEKPFTLKAGSNLADVAAMIHADVAANLKTARVWGSTVHDGSIVRPDYVIQDKDVVEIRT